jgi:hypothetical protein
VYEDLIPGVYEANLTDWGLFMVEKIGQPEIVLHFEFNDPPTGKSYKVKFRSFLYKKDGDLNKKTIDTLKVVGFSSSKITDLNDDPSSINNTKKYSIDVNKNTNGYWEVSWVNDLGGKSMDKVSAKKSLAGYDLSKFNGALMQNGFVQPKKVVKNYAPGASKDEDSIPF